MAPSLSRLSRAPRGLAREAAIRLGRTSEFSLTVVWLTLGLGLVPAEGVALVQVVCLMTMVLSTCWVVFTLPSPLAVTDRLKQN